MPQSQRRRSGDGFPAGTGNAIEILASFSSRVRCRVRYHKATGLPARLSRVLIARFTIGSQLVQPGMKTLISGLDRSELERIWPVTRESVVRPTAWNPTFDVFICLSWARGPLL
jgi:hypothetical protein